MADRPHRAIRVRAPSRDANHGVPVGSATMSQDLSQFEALGCEPIDACEPVHEHTPYRPLHNAKPVAVDADPSAVYAAWRDHAIAMGDAYLAGAVDDSTANSLEDENGKLAAGLLAVDPATWDDVVHLAELASFRAVKIVGAHQYHSTEMTALTRGDDFDRTAAHLIRAILRLGHVRRLDSANRRSDPITQLLREYAVVQELASMAADGEEEDLHSNRAIEIERLLATRRATSAEGAVAALLFLRTDLEEFCSNSFNDHQWQLYHGLIDSAVGVLRSPV